MLQDNYLKNITKIYCDFDGTITKKDAVNTFLELYADPQRTYYEKLWTEGKISSRENAVKQVALLPELSQEKLDEYIDSIEIDEYFDLVKQALKLLDKTCIIHRLTGDPPLKTLVAPEWSRDKKRLLSRVNSILP